ncbi:MAG: redoxin domain-containing protein [Patescibacteria group bacterium]
MKLETIIGAVIVGAFLIGVFLYNAPSKKVGLIDANAPSKTLEEKKRSLIVAPDISSPDGFINTEGKSISLTELKGKKVVLLDIWTYSCINCQRTIPRLNELYEKYKDQGLEIVGLHTPEFSFEKVQKNVEDAVKRFDIKYPVVLDNDFSTWNAYGNRYWPRKYLIDIDGYIVYDHIGEGAYDDTERAVQKALLERSQRLGIALEIPMPVVEPVAEESSRRANSPEIYFGSARNDDFANGSKFSEGMQKLVIPEKTEKNKLYLGGTWTMTSEYSESKSAGSIFFKYSAKDVYMVASAKDGVDVEVWIDGVLQSTLRVQGELLYDIVKGKDYGEHTLELKVKSPGLQAFTFTFG